MTDRRRRSHHSSRRSPLSLRWRGLTHRTRLALVAGLSVYLLLVGAGAGYAAWSIVTSTTGSATAAGVSVSLSGPSALATTYTTSPSATVVAPLTLGNTGTVDVSLALSSTSTNLALAAQISLRLWVRSGASCPATPPVSGVTTGSLAVPPALPTGATSLSAGASVVVCAASEFTGTYASYAGQTTTATLTLTATLTGTTWTAAATSAVTQNLQAIASAPAFTCVNGTGLVTISWPNTSTANTGTTYRSRVNGSIAGDLAAVHYYHHEYSNQGISGTGLPNVAGVYPWVIEETTNGVTTTAYSGQIEVYKFEAWNAWSLRCV